MASLIHELENNEALLLMYVADELSGEDHDDVQQMLASDAGLRAELIRIQSAYDFAMGGLAELDRDRSAAAAENHAIRQANRAMKQWQIDRLTRIPVPMPKPKRQLPFWSYPAAVAALVMISGLIWWGAQDSSLPGTSTAASQPAQLSDSAPTMVAAVETKEDTDKANLLNKSFEIDVPSGIADAETQADSLVARSDDKKMASFFMSDANQ